MWGTYFKSIQRRIWWIRLLSIVRKLPQQVHCPSSRQKLGGWVRPRSHIALEAQRERLSVNLFFKTCKLATVCTIKTLSHIHPSERNCTSCKLCREPDNSVIWSEIFQVLSIRGKKGSRKGGRQPANISIMCSMANGCCLTMLLVFLPPTFDVYYMCHLRQGI